MKNVTSRATEQKADEPNFSGTAMDGETALALLLALFNSVLSFTRLREECFGNRFGLFFSNHGETPLFLRPYAEVKRRRRRPP